MKIVLAVAMVAVWLASCGPHAADVSFEKVKLGRVESTLETNGKVEPSEWMDVRAERDGLVERVFVEKGRQVAKGGPIASMDVRDARSDLAAAEARIAQARADLDVLQRGGSAGQLTEIESGLKQARYDRDAARRELETLTRLQKQQAATTQEVTDVRLRMERADLQIQALEAKRGALVSQSDKTVAEARLRDAEAAAQAAQRRISAALVRSPMAGTVYNIEARAGGYLSLGALVAQVGKLEKMRVRVYVDEPELARVEKGMPVTITWDAAPGRKWTGTVETVPTQVTSLGTRQVGEVVCIVDNADRELLPGTSINAAIQSKVVENALSMPREALRKQGGETGVFVLEGDRAVWRPVTTGISSLTRVGVTSGLKEGDAVALSTDAPLKNGDRVKAVLR